MTYKVRFTDKALKELKKLDKYNALFIMAWIRKNLDGCEDPRQFGKGLTANRSGKWRYRIGQFRLIADIQDNELLILVLTVGHRREVYNSTP